MLEVISSQFGSGGSGLSDGTLRDAIKELQSKRTKVVAGAAANTNIALAGVKMTDTIGSVLAYNAGVPSDITATVSITSAGNIQSTGDTTGATLVVEYYVKP